MAVGQRPGGLTVLAVINFVCGGCGALGLLAMIAGVAMLKSSGYQFSDPKAQAAMQQIAHWLPLLLGVSIVSMLLLVISGFGFLKQRRVQGRYLGSAYGIFRLVMAYVNVAIIHQPFGIAAFIGLIYPLLVLILVNTTFRNDLTA